MKIKKSKRICLVAFVALLFVDLNIVWADVADYAGVYAGTYNSSVETDDAGVFRCSIETDGALFFILWSTIRNTGLCSSGTVDAYGNFSCIFTDEDVTISGYIDVYGNMAGTGSSGSHDGTGAFSGQIVTTVSISPYVGEYSGLLAGDNNEEWSGTVYSDGRVTSADNQMKGAIGPDGRFVMADDDTGNMLYGEILAGSTVMGYWYNVEGDAGGSLTGSSSDMDDDEDGYTENQGDCNDGDVSVYPGAVEVCGDNIDQDCDGADTSCEPDDTSDDDSDDFSDDDDSDDSSDDDDGDDTDATDTSDDSSSGSNPSAGCFLMVLQMII